MSDSRPKIPRQKKPASTILHIVSNVVMAVSAVLLLIDLFGAFKTYVGGVLLGAGFFIEGLSRLKIPKDKRTPQSKPAIVFGIAAFCILAGIVYMVFDLR